MKRHITGGPFRTGEVFEIAPDGFLISSDEAADAVRFFASDLKIFISRNVLASVDVALV